jgi:hypothetical protein
VASKENLIAHVAACPSYAEGISQNPCLVARPEQPSPIKDSLGGKLNAVLFTWIYLHIYPQSKFPPTSTSILEDWGSSVLESSSLATALYGGRVSEKRQRLN